MSTTKADPRATVQAQAEDIVTSGRDIRPRLGMLVASLLLGLRLLRSLRRAAHDPEMSTSPSQE
jgi:hypothetical protein